MARVARPAVVTAEIVVPWRKDPRVVRLTRQIIDLQAKATAKMVTAVVAIGQRMAEVHDRLPEGEWVAWVAEAVPLDRRTIHNYIALYRWSQRASVQFERFAHLGPTKLYVLAAGDPNRVRKLRLGARIALPGGRGRKTIGDMTVAELKIAIAGNNVAAEPRPAAPIGKLVQSAAKGIEGVGELVEQLEDREGELPDGAADELAAELRELADRLDALD